MKRRMPKWIFSSILIFLVPGCAAIAHWDITTVDSTGTIGEYSSITMDDDDNPHIAYYDSTNQSLKLAIWDDGNWDISVVDPAMSPLADIDIELNSDDYPVITYSSVNDGTIVCASWDGSTWSITDAVNAGSFGALAIDSNDDYHLAYLATAGGGSYKTYNGSSWSTGEEFDGSADLDFWSSIVVDSFNQPHISYYDDGVEGLGYAFKDSTWQVADIDDGFGGCYYTSIALDSAEFPHISYCAATPDTTLKYAYWDGASWQVEPVDTLIGTGLYSSLALDDNDYVHISYYDEGNTNLRYVMRDSTTWTTPTVIAGGAGDLGLWTSIVLDDDGMPYISFFSESDGDLMMAREFYPIEETQNDWSGGPTATEPVTVWTNTFESEIDIDYSVYEQLTLAEAKDFALNGDLTSAILDLGVEANPRWIDISWIADTPTSNASTAVTIQLRTGNAWGAMGSWSGDIITPGSLEGIIPDGERYVQYKIKLSTDDVNVTPTFYDINISWEDSTGIDDGENGMEPNIPTGYLLEQSYPNPTDNTATIKFALPVRSTVSLELFDIKGRKISTVAKGEYDAGTHTAEVGNLTSGIYLYRLTVDEFTATKKMVVR